MLITTLLFQKHFINSIINKGAKYLLKITVRYNKSYTLYQDDVNNIPCRIGYEITVTVTIENAKMS